MIPDYCFEKSPVMKDHFTDTRPNYFFSDICHKKLHNRSYFGDRRNTLVSETGFHCIVRDYKLISNNTCIENMFDITTSTVFICNNLWIHDGKVNGNHVESIGL